MTKVLIAVNAQNELFVSRLCHIRVDCNPHLCETSVMQMIYFDLSLQITITKIFHDNR